MKSVLFSYILHYPFLFAFRWGYEEEWDEVLYRQGRTFYAYAYVWNKSDDYCSEFGTIIRETVGRKPLTVNFFVHKVILFLFRFAVHSASFFFDIRYTVTVGIVYNRVSAIDESGYFFQ